MLKLKDQIGTELIFEKTPQRIISLVPSITELLIELGAADSIIGRTKFCIYPQEKIKSIQKVGGTKNPQIDKIIELKPDLIIANKEENLKEHIALLSQNTNCYVSEIKSVDEALRMINDLGLILNKEQQALDINNKINEARQALKTKNQTRSVLYLIWNNPYMSVGHDTYINSFLNEIGYKNILPENTFRYPTIDLESIKELSPQKLLLSDEPFPFKEKHRQELQTLLPNIEVELINGSYCSWYGSRILAALNYYIEKTT